MISDEKVQLATKEYESHVLKLSDDLNKACTKYERVAGLKIACPMWKLLADTNMPLFYPATFVIVIVTDELETFGEVMLKRLKIKAK